MKEKNEKIAAWICCIAVVAAGCLYWLIAFSGPLEPPPRAREKMDISTLTSALRAYKMDTGVFPTTEQGLAALVHMPTIEPIPERWKATMKKVITNRWKQEYHYRQPGVHNPGSFDLWSLGPDGIESEDDIGNWD